MVLSRICPKVLIALSRKEKPMKTTTKLSREIMRGMLNKKIGSIVSTKDFFNKTFAANYLVYLRDSGFVQRVSLGHYKILKKITLKKRGTKKGNTYNHRLKDLSTIPAILNSSKDGLVMRQIQTIYENITPKEKRVASLYLYRILKFAKEQGLVAENGVNKKMRRDKGPYPTRVILTNPNITVEEWNQLVSEYRLWYQYKKENKVKRKSNPKTIMEKFKNSDSIIDSFDEDRDNPNKQFVEDYFINIVQKHLGKEHINCFTITGPDYFRHVIKLFNTIANKVIICELKPDVFDVIYRKAQVCPHYTNNKVSLLNCNVDDVVPLNCYYMDIDLMGNLDNISKSILKQIKNQDYSCNKNRLKFMTFTTSTRNDGGIDNRLRALKNLLYEGFELKLESFQNGKSFDNSSKSLSFCLQHILDIKEFGRVKDLTVFTYQDCTQMMTVLVVYE